jgi:uncharacterized protein
MFSVQRLFRQDDQFFDLLEASAQESSQSVRALTRVLSHPREGLSLAEFHESKEADKKITEQINEALVNVFITELEREDIELLSATLYKIPKTVEKIAERFIVSVRVIQDVEFSKHIALLDTATNQVVEMVKQLRQKPTVETIKRMNAKLQTIEAEGDKLILDVLKDLYSGAHDPIKVLALKDFYELLEKVIDRCRDAGNAVSHIVLKSA